LSNTHHSHGNTSHHHHSGHHIQQQQHHSSHGNHGGHHHQQNNNAFGTPPSLHNPQQGLGQHAMGLQNSGQQQQQLMPQLAMHHANLSAQNAGGQANLQAQYYVPPMYMAPNGQIFYRPSKYLVC
jgi:hypothetical protein